MSSEESVNSDFKLSSEEAVRLRAALKKEEFRKLLVEYAQEISDPANKKLYEEEITKLEQQRGVDVKFVESKPGYVLKVPESGSKRKLFINVCPSDTMDPATLVPQSGGQQWNIPYCITNIREDIDKNKNKCNIIDVYFHPDTYKKGEENRRFSQLLLETILDGVEKQRGIKVERKKTKRLRMHYKGMATPTVIRTRTGEAPSFPEHVDSPINIPYPPLEEEEQAKKLKSSQRKTKEKSIKSSKSSVEPQYNVLYRGEMDMLDFAVDIGSEARRGRQKRPKEIVVTVELPELSAAGSVELDIFERRLLLHNDTPRYHLDLPLSYPVDDEHSSAKFDKSKRSLIIVLPVTSSPIQSFFPLSPSIGLDTQYDDVVSHSEQVNDSDPNGEQTHDERTNGTSLINGDLVTSSNYEHSDWSVGNDSWKCPPFSYSQEDSHVSFVLHVTGVKKSSLNTYFDNDQAQLTFKGDFIIDSSSTSASASSFQQDCYSFYVKFRDGCVVDSDKCSVNINEKNLVMLIEKEKNSQCQWQSFAVGPNFHQTQEKLFLTENNVMQFVESLDSLPSPWSRTGLSGRARAEVVSTSDTEAVIRVTDETNPQRKDKDKETKEDMAVDEERMCDVMVKEQHETTDLRVSSQEIPATDKKSKKVHWSVTDQMPSLPSCNGNSQHSDKMVSDVEACHLGLQSTDPSLSLLSSDTITQSSPQTNLKFSNSLLFDLD